MELAAVLERVRMADVEQQLPLHRAIGDDARRHALAQALPHQVAAVGESLERVVRRERVSSPEPEERIEAVEHVPQRRVELEARRRERAARDRQVDQRGIGHVVGDVLRKPRVNRILGFCESVFHTRPMCTASALCIGIRGDTWPHSAGGQLALGSGNVACAEAPGHGPRESHASTQEPAATHAIVFLFDLFIGAISSLLFSPLRCRRFDPWTAIGEGRNRHARRFGLRKSAASGWRGLATGGAVTVRMPGQRCTQQGVCPGSRVVLCLHCTTRSVCADRQRA